MNGSRRCARQTGNRRGEIADQIVKHSVQSGTPSNDHAIPGGQLSGNFDQPERMRKAATNAIAFVCETDFFSNCETEPR